jgi:ethanolamine utilization protein EutP (predicted NTPase)|tara:strand:+ start:49384 stop:49503 length:120 start_codon:yes stop_codon:yes gene_type:complete
MFLISHFGLGKHTRLGESYAKPVPDWKKTQAIEFIDLRE